MARGVILLGKGALACRIAEWFRDDPDHELRYVVPVVPEPTWTDSLITWCRHHDVPFVDSGHYDDIPCVDAANWRIDLFFSVFYDKILPGRLLSKARYKLNLHNGPLPRYRGIAPINWALKNNERTHGVTIHEMSTGIDAGRIVSQVLFDIFPKTDEVIDVYRRALAYGYTLFEQTLPMLDRIEPRPQDESAASYYSAKDRLRLGNRRDFTRSAST